MGRVLLEEVLKYALFLALAGDLQATSDRNVYPSNRTRQVVMRMFG